MQYIHLFLDNSVFCLQIVYLTQKGLTIHWQQLYLQDISPTEHFTDRNFSPTWTFHWHGLLTDSTFHWHGFFHWYGFFIDKTFHQQEIFVDKVFHQHGFFTDKTLYWHRFFNGMEFSNLNVQPISTKMVPLPDKYKPDRLSGKVYCVYVRSSTKGCNTFVLLKINLWFFNYFYF